MRWRSEAWTCDLPTTTVAANPGDGVNGAVYDALLAVPEWLGLARLRAQSLVGLTGRVLEIGAGTGANAVYLRDTELLIQSDAQLALLRRARCRTGGVGMRPLLVVARAEALPFADAVYDTTLGTLVLCSVQDPIQALRELARVTRAVGNLRLARARAITASDARGAATHPHP